MRAILILVSILAVGCGGCADKVLEPTEVSAVSVLPVRATAECQPFDLEWQIDTDMSGAHVVLRAVDEPSLGRVHSYETQERSGNPWQPVASGSWEHAGNFTGHFDTDYRVRGQRGLCWSSWHEFSVGPANPDASDTGASVPPGNAFEWTQCVEHYVELVTFQPPVVGVYEIAVITKDRFHRPGYQVGQVETLKVETDGWVGFTNDIPDTQPEVTTAFGGVHAGAIRLTKSQGSVHGVCVTVRQ